MAVDPDLELEQLQAELVAHADKNAPERIYLQRSYDDLDSDWWPRDTSWCEDAIEDYDVEYVRSATAQAELAALRERVRELEETAVCNWRYEESPTWDVWQGECGAMWSLNDGTPADNDMQYCPKCGRLLVAQLATAEGGE